MKKDKIKHEGIKKPDEERKKNIADLLREAKGDNRTFVEYAKAAGISPAALSRIINGHYIPTPITMRKLTSQNAEPQGGVTYEDLMAAAGYESKESEMSERMMAYTESFNRLKKDDYIDRREIHSRYTLYEEKCISTIYDALVQKGFLFRRSYGDGVTGSRFGCDLIIDTFDQPIEKWMFEFKYYLDRQHTHPMMMDSALASALKVNVDKSTKLSIVINSKNIFQRMKSYDHALSFRGELSIILYDEDKEKFVEECYLSNYYEEDRTKEIYLVKP